MGEPPGTGLAYAPLNTGNSTICFGGSSAGSAARRAFHAPFARLRVDILIDWRNNLLQFPLEENVFFVSQSAAEAPEKMLQLDLVDNRGGREGHLI